MISFLVLLTFLYAFVALVTMFIPTDFAQKLSKVSTVATAIVVLIIFVLVLGGYT